MVFTLTKNVHDKRKVLKIWKMKYYNKNQKQEQNRTKNIKPKTENKPKKRKEKRKKEKILKSEKKT